MQRRPTCPRCRPVPMSARSGSVGFFPRHSEKSQHFPDHTRITPVEICRCWLFALGSAEQVTVFRKTVTCFLSHQSKSQHRQILTEKIVTKIKKCWLFESCLVKKPTPEKYAEITCDLALCLVTSLPHCSQHRRNVIYFSANCKNIQHYARTA